MLVTYIKRKKQNYSTSLSFYDSAKTKQNDNDKSSNDNINNSNN